MIGDLQHQIIMDWTNSNLEISKCKIRFLYATLLSFFFDYTKDNIRKEINC